LNWSCGMLQTAWIVCTDPAIWNWGIIHGSIGRIWVHESILLTLRRASALLLVRNWRANSILSRGGRRRSDACFLDRLPGPRHRSTAALSRASPWARGPAACSSPSLRSRSRSFEHGFSHQNWLCWVSLTGGEVDMAEISPAVFNIYSFIDSFWNDSGLRKQQPKTVILQLSEIALVLKKDSFWNVEFFSEPSENQLDLVQSSSK
jgi:hypothetical protein